ncbi:MAG: prepilin peptidase [Syntrophobacterales bacterium]|nr:prepilin peptidase [Syntrophobacterales bacterium]
MTFDRISSIYVILLIVFGAIMGSFFNMLIYRTPRGLSILGPSSFCPKCEKPIPWWGNIPLLSYIILRRRCVYCKGTIPLRYLLVEILTPTAYVLLYLRNSDAGMVQWGIEALFVSLLIIVTFTDIETYLIPDIFSIGGIFIGLFLSPWNRNLTFLESLFGVIVGGGVLLLIAYGYQKLRGVEGMGGGDVKLLAMIGAFTGWKGAIFALFSSAFVGTIAGFVVMMQSKKSVSRDDNGDSHHGNTLSTMIPYGPFLALGGIGALLWGDDFWRWYLGGF